MIKCTHGTRKEVANLKKTLKDIREELGMTQSEFAKAFGYKSRDNIAKKERGEVALTIHDLRVLKEKYDVDLNQLKELD